jgi:hypothetical protein
MKKKKNILKLLKNALVSNLLLLSSISFAQSTVDITSDNDIRQFFKQEIKQILRKYNTENFLEAEIYDSGKDEIKRFLSFATKTSADNQLAVSYFPISTNPKAQSSFCFIFYDSKNNIFQSYEQFTFLSREDYLRYLVLHEMGHCLPMHENKLLNGRNSEIIADMFAISVAVNNKHIDLPDKILQLIYKLNINDIHSNGDYLKFFLDNLYKSRLLEQKKNMNQIMHIIYFYFQNGSFLNFKE